jgi:hypothetical protein
MDFEKGINGFFSSMLMLFSAWLGDFSFELFDLNYFSETEVNKDNSTLIVKTIRKMEGAILFIFWLLFSLVIMLKVLLSLFTSVSEK